LRQADAVVGDCDCDLAGVDPGRTPIVIAHACRKASPATQMNGRELEILRLLGRGDKIVEVASALGISYKTVANTTSLLKQKLGARNHSDLVRIAVEMELG
jgi:DNA-binding CsgD family transcriptional regulator